MKMKSTLRLAGLLAVLASSPAWSIPIGEVGSVDQLIAQTALPNSGDDTEKNWVAGVLGIAADDLTYDSRTEFSGGSGSWQQVSGAGAGVWAFEFSDEGGFPSWFLLKTGNIQGQPNSHFLFNNLASFQYAVVRLLDLGITQVSNVAKISHIGEFSGPGREVPEPAPLALLGMGLLGLALARRKRTA